MNLREVVVEPLTGGREDDFQTLMQAHHYLGALPRIGRTVRYVAQHRGELVALLCFSAAAWKCAARDAWIGWSYRHQYDRLHLLANNSRFLILPGQHWPNLASRVLSLCERRLAQDWLERFGHPLLLLETFVDPRFFHGTVYRAANWVAVGQTRGFRRTSRGYSAPHQDPKKVYLRPLHPRAAAILSQPLLAPPYRHGAPKLMLPAETLYALPSFFADIPDPRRPQGRRHPLPVVLSIATAAALCGRRGWQAIAEWAQDLGQKARARLGCRRRNGHYQVPSESIIRDVLIRVGPDALDAALQRWNAVQAVADESLAIDGKTLRATRDEAGRQTHILGLVGHHSQRTYTQKKSPPCR